VVIRSLPRLRTAAPIAYGGFASRSRATLDRVAAADPLALIDQTIDGTYRVDALLGRGGMGAVFRAVHLGTDRIVALKVIAPALAAEPEYLERFRREARACGRLRHPNIVDVTDFGVTRHEGRELAYLVMEFLDGCTLADVLRQEPTPPLPWVIDMLEQTCDAVEEAHRHSILHRDLKPDNIWLEPNRRGGYSVKVLDFGLARLEPSTGSAPAAAPATPPRIVLSSAVDQTFASGALALDNTPTIGGAASGSGSASSSVITTFAGTPGYMSPEQASGGDVTARSDVYSLGVIAYRMLAGREPFTGSVTDVIQGHLSTPPPPLRDLRADVPVDAANLIMQALSKDPAERPSSAGAFGNMLAGQLLPASAFFPRVITLMVERFALFASLAAICFAPALAFSVLLAAWAMAVAWWPWVPPPRGPSAIVAFSIFGTLLMVGSVLQSVLPVVVLHALAAPLRPIDLRSLRTTYEPRVRRWLTAMKSFFISRGAWLALMLASLIGLVLIGPAIRPLPRLTRLAIALGVLAVPALTMMLMMRRERLGMRQGLFLGPVMLVEGLPLDAARRRSVELSAKSGMLQQKVRTRYLAGLILFSMATGLLLGRARLNSTSIAAITPLLALFMAALTTFSNVVTASMYFTARRATGDSLDRVLEDFERAALPDTHWQRAHRDRVQDQLRTARGDRFAVASAASPPTSVTRGDHGTHLRGPEAQDDR
jgi:serine/threonine protein kinase